MGDTVAGISLPPGNPGAIEDAAQGLKQAGSGFGQAADTARAAAASVSWTGTASEAFGARTGDYEDAGRKADAAAMQAAGVLTRFAKRLEEGIDRVKRLQDRALDAEQRMQTATNEAIAAGLRETAARTRAAAITVTTSLDITGSTLADQSAALQEADDAATERVRYEGIADRAREELEQLREEARQEREAVKEAASSAAGELNGAQDGLPVVYRGGMYGTAGGMEDRVLTGVRNGDYSVLEGLSLETLDEDTQRAVGGEIAKDADEAAYNEGDHSLSEVSSVVTRFGADEDFAVGFYNQLGGRGTADLAQNITTFHGRGEGLDDPALIALMAPYANMLGTATRSSDLRRGFTSGFMRKDLSVRDRYGGHGVMSAFVMSGTASRYSPQFLSAIGEEVMITPTADPDDGIVHHELSENQEMMEFIAGNREAASMLLAGKHGPGNHFSNAAPLLMYGPRYTDDGAALGTLIEAGTLGEGRDDRSTQLAASEAVIKATPEFADHMPDGAKSSLVNVFEEHVAGFEYAAVHEANPGVAYHRGDNVDITYDEGREYLSSIMGFGGEHRESVLQTTAGRVENHVYEATGLERNTDARTRLMERAGGLQEMTSLSAIDADLTGAERQEQQNDVKKYIAGKAIDLAGGRVLERIPGSDIVLDKLKDGVFPTDQVEQALRDAQHHQFSAEERINFLVMAGEVQHGNLPVEVIQAQNLDGGTDSYDLNQDGDERDTVTRFDVDGDGTRESLAESDLRNLVGDRVNDQTASDTMSALEEIEDADENPASFDDFKHHLPDGYRLDEDWLSNDEVYNSSDNEVNYEITRDRAEYVLTLKDPDGADVQVRARRVDGEWVPAP